MTSQHARKTRTGGEYLQDSNGLVEHRLGVGEVVGGGERVTTEVRLQQQVCLRVRRVESELVDFDGKLLRQLAVDLVLVVANRKVRVLVRALKPTRQ